MIPEALKALDRTARLLSIDLFNGQVSLDTIVAGLIGTTARIVISQEEAASVGGQHALASLVLHLAMNGIGIDLRMPHVPLLVPQPPLRGDEFRSALLDHVSSTWPWVRLGPAAADVEFVIGCSGGEDAVVVSAGPQRCRVGPEAMVKPLSFEGAWPVGPIAAGIAAGAEAVRIAVANIAEAERLPYPSGIVRPGETVVDLVLRPQPMSATGIESTVFISAGAITTSALFVLLRVPELRGDVRVFDDDLGAASNLNRYPLLTREAIDERKVDALAALSTSSFTITGSPRRYTQGDTRGVRRMMIGADDIAIRWDAQRDAPEWLVVGATSHLFGEVSTHTPHTACAGCVHDHEDERPEVIPTISIVSGWTGLLAACALLDEPAAAGSQTWAYPLGLGGRGGQMTMPVVANPRCPVRCTASSSSR